MDKLTAHFDQLAQDDEAKERAMRESETHRAKGEAHEAMARLDRMLASEDVAWFLGQMQALADAEQKEALSLRNTETEARHHSHRLDMANTIIGWMARKRAQIASELQSGEK